MKLLSVLLFMISTSVFGAQTATYQVTITSNWNVDSHLGLPGPAHFSPVVAVSHNSDYSVFPVGQTATKGFERVAELGDSTILVREIKKAKKKGKVGSYIVTENQFVREQVSQTFEVKVTKKHPYLSFVSMIAPSPDWVIGLPSTKLFSKTNGFTEEAISLDLFAYDAGTEEGDFGGNFSLNNRATNPLESLSILTGRGFNDKFATLLIERID